MPRKMRGKIADFCSRSILILIALYSYFSSVYLSNFAELHLTIPKIGLPVFVGEILLFLVILLSGLVFFLEKDRISVSPRQFIKKYWFIAVFFIFVAAKALLGLYRHGFLALRNSAMFYYLTFAFITYYFYRPGLFKPVLRYAALIVLSATLLFSDSITYFLYSYYMFMLIFLLRGRPRQKVFGLALLLIIFVIRAEYFFSQPKAALVSFGVALMYLVFSLAVYLCRKIKNKKLCLSAIMLAAIVFISSFILNNSLRRKMSSFPEYLDKYNEIKKEIDSALKDNYYSSKKTEKMELFQNNRNMKEQTVKNILVESELLENKRPRENNKSEFKGSDSLLNDKKKWNHFMDIYGLLSKNTEHLLSDNYAKEKAQALEKIAVVVIEGMYKTIKPIQLESYKLVCENVRQGKPAVQIEDRFAYTLKRLNDAWMENAQKYIKTITRQNLPSGIPPDTLKALEEEIEISIKDIVLKKANKTAIDIVYGVPRSSAGHFNNIMWRVFVWRDMLQEATESKKTLLLGMDFGYPFRSKSMEILRWSDGGWVGWLEPHNSYVHIFYRAGIIGIALITVIIVLFLRAALHFAVNKNITGVMLVSVLFYWLSLTFFMVVLELPYFAIPFWSLFGAVLKYEKLSAGSQCR